MRVRILAFVALLTPLVLLHGTSPAQHNAVNSIGNLLPDNAQVAVVIPNLKRLSDDVTQMLEGMDRANVLIGSRPLDQLKSVTGFNVAINDMGGAAIILFRRGQQDQTPLFIVPVTDAQAFLNGNFKVIAGNEYSLPNGNVVYAKALPSHVAISPRAEIVDNYEPSEGVLAELQESLGEQAMPLMRNCELFVVVRQGGAKAMRQAMIEAAGPTAAKLPVEQFEAFADVDTAIAAIDLDPLALVVRKLASFTPESSIGSAARQGEAAGSLNALPNKPFYVAASANLKSIGGDETFRAFAKVIGAQDVPQWLRHATRIDFAAYPSPAGISGGLLNDAVLVMHSSNPAELKSEIKNAFNTLSDAKPVVARQITWQEGKNVEGVGAVDAYEARTVEDPQSLPIQQMVERIVFGQMGIRGFIHTTDNAVLMTFSQRPAVLKNAIAAAENSSTSLANSPVLKSMQAWLPSQRDFELYLGLGQIAETARQIAASFGAAHQAQMPDFDAKLPPIAVGVDVIDAGMQSTIVIPSGVLAAIIDAAMANMQGRGGEEEWDSP